MDIFNSTDLNILSNFILHELLACDDKEPPWFNKKITTLIQEKNAAFKSYRNNSGTIDLKCRLKYLQGYLDASVEVAKEKCHNK